ncbi:hypothetical protein [Halpernia frigidisoli]|uniref:Uncharacterized protein n=1 Tax=Halpernia frigidisoli TaxID=1125876 RepID=A0A1I3I0E9_9FLAO|nr:hypothetical protein [Halpernia frigidisoli]SFI41330.1 hypothetical protein SAMN05443292_2491 [Halpernia frigidisoli]
MKKTFISALLFNLLLMTSCTKETTTINSTGDSTTTVTKIGIDNPKVDSAKIKVNNGIDKTGDALEKGAKDVKEGLKKVTADAAAAVERGAKDVKEDAKK